MSEPERLNGDALRAAFPDREILILEETTSTNDVVFEAGLRAGKNVVAFAERQTAGRGQHGKRWESAAGKGLWFSLRLEQPISPRDSVAVTRAAAEAIALVVNEQFSLGATVKPPNDVYVTGRKLAGVLLELRAVPNGPHAPILGVGVNVHHRAEDFPIELRGQATSLAMLTRGAVDREALAIVLLRRLIRLFGRAIDDKPAAQSPMA